MPRLALAIALVAMTSSAAYPCMNGIILEGDEGVRRIVELEHALDAGDYGRVGSTLGDAWIKDARLEPLVADLQMMAALRAQPKSYGKRAATYLEARTSQLPKSIKHRAWLAEAYVAAGKREEAMQILLDLQKRDLMPGAHAYVALAKLTSGEERDAAIDTCKKRAVNKAVCALPLPVWRQRQLKEAARTTRSSKMRLP
jgi:hypothetical protein